MTLRAPLLVFLAACPPTGAGTTDASTSAAPASTTSPTEPTTGGTTDACDGSSDCDSEGICVAPYTPSADPNDPGSRGAAACLAKDACIGALDLERFCFDHQGCCESLRCRTVDGVCEPPKLGQTTGDDTTSTSTGADTTSTTGTTTDDTSSTADTDTTG